MIGGKYRPRSILGSGATGTVYAVEHTFTGDLLALKLMKSHLGASPDAIARFKREARAASRIRSQHVVRIFDADIAQELDGAPYLVMDLLEGSDLEQISHGNPVAPENVVGWLRQVAAPLDKAHRIGIVHRDLKPENLFLTRLDDGTAVVKILDFGIARIAAESPGTTQSGQVFGTPLYMAPEQARGDPTQVGPATDLFGLGQIAYTLLTGALYRTGTNLAQLMNEILNEPNQAPSERGFVLGAEFDQWFLRACHPDPAKRFGSAYEQVEALARALGLPAAAEITEESSFSVDPEPPSRPSPPSPVELAGARADSSGNAISRSLRPMALEANAITSANGGKGAHNAKDGDMPTSTVSDDPAANESPSKRRWRVAVFAIAVLVGGPLLALALSGRMAVQTAEKSSPSACPVPSAAATLAAVEPSASSPSAAAPNRVEAPQATTSSARPATAEREVVVRSMPRAITAHAVATRRITADDDPLSDQQ
jgi:eukaryotic-like serine/threonine-protein kinase